MDHRPENGKDGLSTSQPKGWRPWCPWGIVYDFSHWTLAVESALHLIDQETDQVFELVLQTEKCFGSPQDVEWTFLNDQLYVLQARPITTAKGQAGDDERSWYLSLHRSFDNLKALRTRIEETLLPAMEKEAQQLSQQSVEVLSDAQLAEDIQKRSHVYEKWSKIYWDEFIPMAHGMRLFGEVYNKMMHPEDPYEFMRLLGATDMLSLRRNNMLAKWHP